MCSLLTFLTGFSLRNYYFNISQVQVLREITTTMRKRMIQFQGFQWMKICLFHFPVVNAIISGVVAGVLRCSYKGMDILGTVLIALTVKIPKVKDQIPPIGPRNLLRESVTSIAEKVRFSHLLK